MEFRVNHIEELSKVAKSILTAFSDERIFVFIGKMGAGKTTFIQQICTQLGVTDQMSSPTFSIVNEYMGTENAPIYHFDFYRFEKEEEALDMGLEEYLDSGGYCFIEWPDKAGSFLPDRMVVVRITVENGIRTITAEFN